MLAIAGYPGVCSSPHCLSEAWKKTADCPVARIVRPVLCPGALTRDSVPAVDTSDTSLGVSRTRPRQMPDAVAKQLVLEANPNLVIGLSGLPWKTPLYGAGPANWYIGKHSPVPSLSPWGTETGMLRPSPVMSEPTEPRPMRHCSGTGGLSATQPTGEQGGAANQGGTAGPRAYSCTSCPIPATKARA